MCSFFVCGFYIKEKCKQTLNLVNDMLAIIFKKKCTDLCSILWSVGKDKMEGKMGKYMIKQVYKMLMSVPAKMEA